MRQDLSREMLAHHVSTCPGLGGRGWATEEGRKPLVTKEMEQEAEGGRGR